MHWLLLTWAVVFSQDIPGSLGCLCRNSIFSSGYTGAQQRGDRHGKGVQVWPSGSSYEGEWRHDLMHGKGKFSSQDGAYEGSWVDDKRSGQGKFVRRVDGSVYEGDWLNDKRHGVGTLVCILLSKCPFDACCSLLRLVPLLINTFLNTLPFFFFLFFFLFLSSSLLFSLLLSLSLSLSPLSLSLMCVCVCVRERKRERKREREREKERKRKREKKRRERRRKMNLCRLHAHSNSASPLHASFHERNDHGRHCHPPNATCLHLNFHNTMKKKQQQKKRIFINPLVLHYRMSIRHHHKGEGRGGRVP